MVFVRITHILFTLSIVIFVEPADVDYMKNSIINYFSDTRHHDPRYSTYKARAKEYIFNQFKGFGLTTEYHTFRDNTVSATATFHTVVGILKGTRYGTSADSIVAVGAHYDTVHSTKGVDDNGAGVAALLDVIRQITSTNAVTKRINTIIFASFDLEEYGGLSGSRQFLTTWMPRWLQNNYGSSKPVVQGVIIMDTMMEYDTSSNSQGYPQDPLAFDMFKNAFPEAMASIQSDNFRGDFLTLIYRRPTNDTKLASVFKEFWNKDKRKRFQIESFPTPFGDERDMNPIERLLFGHLYRSDHTNFWRNGIPAIFITDSANFRGDMMVCYHKSCDNLDTMMTDDNIQFLGKTSDIITRTIHQLSGASVAETTTQQVTTVAGTERHDISCDSDSISIFIPTQLLLSSDQLAWRDPHCKATNNGSHFISTVSHTDCGTTVKFTKDEVIFQNALTVSHQTISRAASNGTIDFGGSNTPETIPVQCIYPRRQNISMAYRPAQSHVRFYEKRYGHMDVELEQFHSDKFTATYPARSYPLEVPINKDLYFRVHAMDSNSSDVALRVDKCVATPSVLPAYGKMYQLIDQGCPASPAVKMYPSSYDEVKFSVTAFEFSSSPGSVVYVHCQVSVCPAMDPKCLTGCIKRQRRDVSSPEDSSHLVSGGPYLLVAEEGSVSVPSVVAAVCACIAVVAAVFAVIGWRRKVRVSKLSSEQ